MKKSGSKLSVCDMHGVSNSFLGGISLAGLVGIFEFSLVQTIEYTYKKKGYEINRDYLDERRQDLMCLDGEVVERFLERIIEDECSVSDLKTLFEDNENDESYQPNLYVDFDNRVLYSMYLESTSYQDYVPSGWSAMFADFLHLIPINKRYWQE